MCTDTYSFISHFQPLRFSPRRRTGLSRKPWSAPLTIAWTLARFLARFLLSNCLLLEIDQCCFAAALLMPHHLINSSGGVPFRADAAFFRADAWSANLRMSPLCNTNISKHVSKAHWPGVPALPNKSTIPGSHDITYSTRFSPGRNSPFRNRNVTPSLVWSGCPMNNAVGAVGGSFRRGGCAFSGNAVAFRSVIDASWTGVDEGYKALQSDTKCYKVLQSDSKRTYEQYH